MNDCLSPARAVLLDAGKANCGSIPMNQPETLSAVPLYNLISLIHSLLKEKKTQHTTTINHGIFNTSDNTAVKIQGRGTGRGKEVSEATRGGLLLTPPSALTNAPYPNSQTPACHIRCCCLCKGKTSLNAATKGMREHCLNLAGS